MKFTLAVMALLLLFTFSGCTRRTSGAEMRQEAAEPARVAPGSPEGEAARGGGTVAPARAAAVETPVNAAFYSSGDEGPSAAEHQVRDYELGDLRNPIPPELDSFLQALGGELPAASISEEWTVHLRRQSALFDAGKKEVRLARGTLDEGRLTAACKIIQGDEMILGFLIARRDGDGYRVEDISIDRRLQAPFQALVFPPPAGDGSGRRASWGLQ
jgi:hypothetical protein